MGFAVRGFLISALLAAPAFAGDVTREDVIKLSRAGVSDALIITFLDAKGARFDLSADGIVALKEGGVSEAVIAHMLRSNAPEPAPAPVAGLPASPPVLKTRRLSPPSLNRYDAPRSYYIPVRGPIYYPPLYCYPTYRAYCFPRYSHGYCRHH